MKKILFTIITASFIISCNTTKITSKNQAVNQVNINLVNVQNDQVEVSVKAPKIKSDEITYHIPKIIPGTYSEDDYGKYVERFYAYDAKGNKLPVAKYDVNSWTISDAKKLAKITYWVNDTYDTEYLNEEKIFSPAGTNIATDNFMLNMHGFVGYFDGYKNSPYEITIKKPQNMYGATALKNLSNTNTTDVFKANRYHDVVDNPIMYTVPDTTSFKVDGMDILISVYSPNNMHSAAAIKDAMKTTMQAQKSFLGDFNSTEKYVILLYLSNGKFDDAGGYGALEHQTSTTVVMPEFMNQEMLEEQLKDVVSHEFFHIVTPLSIHSEEIHNFDYNNPKMSQHLWLYEGVTEYFANLFQVNQGLIDEAEFFNRMNRKIYESQSYDDTMPFTKLSKNVLEGEYKDNYINVYQKGALIAMCLDIELREASNGKQGILDLMKQLSKEYGSNKPFKDDELFAKISSLTGPNVKAFIDNHIQGTEPIDYEKYFNKMGVGTGMDTITSHPFLSKNQPIIDINQEDNTIFIPENVELTDFFTTLGIQSKDVIKSINQKEYGLDNIYDFIADAAKWKNGDAISVVIVRDGKEQTINGKVKLQEEQVEAFMFKDSAKKALKDAWLKG
ncbi:peptidase M61 [Flavobacterium agricola]|uniref:Peptidase M61 n=1 Tax=Flavobacterium agricola TaxID=2870839 RepID=A0ABY6M2Q0_9FLAO|nr:peptidase M61 [Flavobacterium agricola]UYW01588.1 peptidase M61 [Flavobacterium agricola]